MLWKKKVSVVSRMVISCTVHSWVQTADHMYSVYNIVQLGPNPVQDTSKANLYRVRIVNICIKNTRKWIIKVNITRVIKACTADSLIHIFTQAGTKAGFMFTFVILFQVQCCVHNTSVQWFYLIILAYATAANAFKVLPRWRAVRHWPE